MISSDVWMVVQVFLAVATPFAIVMLIEHVINTRRREQRRDRLRSRPMLPMSSWFDQNFGSTGVRQHSAEKIAGLLARDLECDVTQLLAADRFDEELHFKGFAFFVASGDISMEHFRCELESLLSEAGAPYNLPINDAATVGELVALCDEYVSEDGECE